MRSIIKGRRGSGDSLASMGNSKQTTIRQMEEFRNVLDECGFQDLGYSGNKFT